MLPAERLNRILLLRPSLLHPALCLSSLFFSPSFLPLLLPSRSLTFSPVYPAGGKDKRPSAGRVPGKFFLSARITHRAFPFVFLTLQSAYFHTPLSLLRLFFLHTVFLFSRKVAFIFFFRCTQPGILARRMFKRHLGEELEL